MKRRKKWISGFFFSAENFLSNKLSDVFCFGFGQFLLAAREIQNEADTWHCANFIAH